MVNKMLAINGGEPLRKKPWPKWPVFDDSELKELEEVIESRFWGGGVGKSGPKEEEFEKKFSSYHGCRYGILVSNGTAALFITLLAAGIGPGDEVIVPDLTFWATGSSVLMAGADLVIVDVSPDTYCMNADEVEDSISDKTKAIIPVYNYGNAPDIDRLLKIARENNLILIEDCARAHGFSWKDKPVGSIGDAGCFSFQQGKFITAGEGGIIVTNNRLYAERAQAIKDCGRIRAGIYDVGINHWWNWFNFRATQFQAAILLAQLKRLDKQLRIRQENSEYLSKRLKEIEGIETLRVNSSLTRYQPWPYVFKYKPKSFKNLSIDKFIKALNAEGIPCWRTEPPLHLTLTVPNGFLSRIKRKKRYPVSERAYFEEAVEIPQYLFLGNKSDMDDIADAIIKIKKYAHEISNS